MSKPISLISSFPPVSDKSARVLILGSMPGRASLDANQYYAHPQNLFWKIMGELVGASPLIPYEERLKILKNKNIALWDVLETCLRTDSSLDSAITQETANDFLSFLKEHPNIKHIFFNGTKAQKSFQKFAANNLPRDFEFIRLPSTSPANASSRFEAKLEKWREILRYTN